VELDGDTKDDMI